MALVPKEGVIKVQISISIINTRYNYTLELDCKVRLKVLYSAENNSVSLEVSNETHDHVIKNKGILTEETKKRMLELYNLNLEPARILNILRVKFF